MTPPYSELADTGTGEAKALAAAGVGFARLIPATGTIEFAPETRALLGIDAATATVQQAIKAVDRTYRRSFAAYFEGAGASREDGLVVPLRIGGGHRRCFRVRLLDARSDADVWPVVLVEVSAEQLEIVRLREINDHLRNTVELNPQLPWQADAAGNVIAFTERYEQLTGLSQEQLLGNGWEALIHPDDLPAAFEKTGHALATGTPLDMRVRLKLANGSYRWFRSTCFPLRDDEGEISRWYGYTEDIDDHVLIEQQIRWTAEHDALTKLPNRMIFNRQLEQALHGENKLGEKVAILLADVDNFKDVNDVLGHDAGDALLMAFADLLGRALPEKAMLSRIGGDEFAVVLPFEGPLSELDGVADDIFLALSTPVAVNGQTIECRVSIGASVYPFHGQSPTELFKNADIALYQAKARGRGQMTLFSLDMKQETQRRVAMINLGRKAVESGSIVPYYQMQVALDGITPIGFEALLRRRDRQGRICAPASIAAAFEDAGVAEALGDAMLTAVLADIVRARGDGIELGTVSVNFSTAEFRSASFVERLTRRISDAGIEYGAIGIEVTESVFLGRQLDTVSETIRTLAGLGFKIALDDFGTGYASLVHLRQLPVDTLKIDTSFIRTLPDNRDDLAIVTAIINLGASLGLNIVGEGIETQAQLDLLRSLNLQYGQGFLFAHPAPIEQACALIAPGRLKPLEKLSAG